MFQLIKLAFFVLLIELAGVALVTLILKFLCSLKKNK